MERRPATQAMYESTAHIERLLKASELGVGSGDKPYTDAELLSMLPAIEAQAHEIGVTCSALRATLQRQLGTDRGREVEL